MTESTPKPISAVDDASVPAVSATTASIIAGADKSSVQVGRLVIGGGRIRLAPAFRRWAVR
jgi:hypothetical protein